MRALRHLLCLPGAVSRAFPGDSLSRIAAAIQASEQLHDGEIRFAVEAALEPAALWRGLSARDRAVEVFAELGVWDTERKNGVLIYLRLAERAEQERRPQDGGRLPHQSSLTMRQVPRASSIAALQRPAGSGGSSAAYLPCASGTSRTRMSCPARVLCTSCANSTSGAAPLSTTSTLD
jgi:hypothetical protein